jgi:acyl-CoA thioesterase FadM
LILEIDWRVKIPSPDVQFERHVSWNDCDPSGRIRYNAAFDWFVDAEVAFLRSLGMAWAFDRMPRVAASATYRLPLRFEDKIVVEVNVAKIGRSAVTYAFRATHGGEEAVVGEVTCVYIVDDKSATIPDDLRAALEQE